MLRPSYSDILEVITQDSEDITIASRYTIVIAAAKKSKTAGRSSAAHD